MVAKKTPAKKAKKTPTKKAPAKKASAKKTPDKKASAKKTPVARKAPAPAKKAAPPKKAVREPQKADSGDESYRAPTLEEEWDYPAEHLEIERRRFAGGEIERRRFAGGLAPTPELYALAREQWYRLPGVVVRPFMDPVVGDQASGEAQLPGQAHPDENGPDQ